MVIIEGMEDANIKNWKEIVGIVISRAKSLEEGCTWD